MMLGFRDEEDRTLNFCVIFIMLVVEEDGRSLDSLPDPGNIIILDIDIISYPIYTRVSETTE